MRERVALTALPVACAAMLIALWTRPGPERVAEAVVQPPVRAEERDARSARILATHGGYAPASQAAPADASEPAVLPAPPSELIGWISFGPRRLHLGGLRVVAVDLSAPPPHLRRVLDGEDPELAFSSATTDATGSFSIPGMDPERTYRLYAGGEGFYTREPTRVGRRRPRAVEVRVEQLFGTRVRFVDGEGVEIEFPPALRAAWWRRELRVEANEGRPMQLVPSDAPYVALAGLDPRLFDGEHPNRRVVLASSPDPDARSGRAGDRGAPPGYSAFGLGYPLAPLAKGVGEARIELREVAASWGSLRLRFVDEASRAALPAERAPWPGILRLTLVEGVALRDLRASGFHAYDRSAPLGELALRLDADRGGEARLEGLPFGRYVALYCDSAGAYAHPPSGAPPLDVTIGARPALLELPVPASHAAAEAGTRRSRRQRRAASAQAGELSDARARGRSGWCGQRRRRTATREGARSARREGARS